MDEKGVKAMIKKIWYSFLFSCHGIKSTFLRESSFRLEIVAIPFLLLVLVFLDVTNFRKLIMVSVYILIPCIELLNSAIEKLADYLTTEYDPMIQFVKDAASAAVFLAIIFMILVWAACIWF